MNMLMTSLAHFRSIPWSGSWLTWLPKGSQHNATRGFPSQGSSARKSWPRSWASRNGRSIAGPRVGRSHACVWVARSGSSPKQSSMPFRDNRR